MQNRNKQQLISDVISNLKAASGTLSPRSTSRQPTSSESSHKPKKEQIQHALTAIKGQLSKLALLSTGAGPTVSDLEDLLGVLVQQLLSLCALLQVSVIRAAAGHANVPMMLLLRQNSCQAGLACSYCTCHRSLTASRCCRPIDSMWWHESEGL